MAALGGEWRVVEVAGKSCDVFEPPSPGPFAIVHLHGVGMETLKGNAVWSGDLERRGLRAICPHGKRSWWTNRVCAEFDEQLTAERFVLDHVMPWVAQQWGVEPPRLGLTGISMGGQGALRLAFKYPSRFPVVAAVSAAIDYHRRHGQGTTIDEMYGDRETARQDTALLHVHPLNWPRNMLFVVDPGDPEWYEGNERLHEKLRALGIPHQCDLETSAGGHSWEYFNHVAPRVMEFVVRSLESEQLRVV